MRTLLFSLLLLLTSLTCMCVVSSPKEIYVKAGEMVVLQCPRETGYNHDNDAVIWIRENELHVNLSSMSATEQKRMILLCLDQSLYILNASVDHQGNYSCSQRNVSGQSQLSLKVYTTMSKELENITRFSHTCYTQEYCKLECPEVNIPPISSSIFTRPIPTWHKNESAEEVNSYFERVEKKDGGVYTCTMAYLYEGQNYKKSFTLVLDVQPKPSSPFEIKCEALINDLDDSLFWLLNTTKFVENNDSFRVFYYEKENTSEGGKNTANLVFKEVTEDDLANEYNCKLESISYVATDFVTITLAKKVRPSYISVALCSLVILAVMAVTVIVYVNFKIEVTLFLRDTLGCHRRTSGGKTYDVFLMYYKSDNVTGLTACDAKWLENVLEENFGYKLCLYDRDVQPGKAAAEALLDCVEQSQTVVLVPSPATQSLDSGLLSTIHAALVERKTSLVVVRTESEEEAKWVSEPEVFRLLEKTGHCVKWQGLNSLSPSSTFWKKLRYHLPAGCIGNKAFPLDALPQ
ncbi:interleukin-1 receptor-like 1 isoform X2 [Corythoichthys intestinalis]|uniref:interleukin-1 receptor-like 1 isoform X2 n=1 Tax=Corythoichthys intestinalis TaxID=161448 RepID=UPI0025A5D164|nr:interleukin-1 receptor-like 1 isoform X2 [Corythoichthys intestinalis]